MYTAFADIYDRLMTDVPYGEWASYLETLLMRRGVMKGGRVTECACGTGSLTLPLRKKGFAMTGLDVSGEMLEIAMTRARDAGMSIPFVRADMTSFHVLRPQDAVLCTCDGVNYLLNERDVLHFFDAAYHALRPGGVLLFDVSTPYKLSKTLGNQTLFRTEQDISYIWENTWNEQRQQVSMALSIFVREQNGMYARVEERQCQRAHDRKELSKWLKDTGFENIEFFGRMRMTPPRTGDDRWHILCSKPENEGIRGDQA